MSFLAATAACALVLVFSTQVASADYYWVGGSGSWDDPANWSNAPDGPGGAGVPNGEWVYFHPTDAVNRTILCTPGEGTFSVGRLEASATGAGSLTFNITRGTFDGSWAQFLVGYTGQAGFVQTGGACLASQLEFGSHTGALGTYELHGGEVLASRLLLGPYGGQGIFRQNGGIATLSDIEVGETSRYELSDGSLTTRYGDIGGYGLYIRGGGQFVQSGGSHAVELLEVEGRYEWTGGTMQIGRRLRVAGEFSFPSSPVSLDVDGIVDLSSGTMSLTNAGNVSLNLTDTSLLIRSASFNPAAAFGSYSNPGFTHVDGNTLTVFPGRMLRLINSFSDPIDCYGQIVPFSGESFSLTNGVILREGAHVNTGSWGSVTTSQGTAEIQGGLLETYNFSASSSWQLSFPPKPPAIARQTGGTVICQQMDVGRMGAGTYELAAGTLTTTQSVVGGSSGLALFQRSGVMTQSGGVHTADTLLIGLGGDATGSYVLSGGTLSVRSLQVSPDGAYPFQTPAYGNGTLDITSAGALITISDDLAFGPNSTYTAVSGTVLHMTGAGGISNMNIDPAAMSGLENTTFIFESGSTDLAPLEAAGLDLGPTLDGFISNFVIDTLQIGGDAGFAALSLQNYHDNQPGSTLADAVYVNRLILNAGSYLDLHGLNLYCRDFINNGGTVLYMGGGQLTVVPEPALPAAALLLLLCFTRRKT